MPAQLADITCEEGEPPASWAATAALHRRRILRLPMTALSRCHPRARSSDAPDAAGAKLRWASMSVLWTPQIKTGREGVAQAVAAARRRGARLGRRAQPPQDAAVDGTRGVRLNSVSLGSLRATSTPRRRGWALRPTAPHRDLRKRRASIRKWASLDFWRFCYTLSNISLMQRGRARRCTQPAPRRRNDGQKGQQRRDRHWAARCLNLWTAPSSTLKSLTVLSNEPESACWLSGSATRAYTHRRAARRCSCGCRREATRGRSRRTSREDAWPSGHRRHRREPIRKPGAGAHEALGGDAPHLDGAILRAADDVVAVGRQASAYTEPVCALKVRTSVPSTWYTDLAWRSP